jgi:transcriptional regulator of acetoin/glycerol metabolism
MIVAWHEMPGSQESKERQFRSDLLYRLRGVEVTLPPSGQRCDFLQIVHALLAALGM